MTTLLSLRKGQCDDAIQLNLLGLVIHLVMLIRSCMCFLILMLPMRATLEIIACLKWLNPVLSELGLFYHKQALSHSISGYQSFYRRQRFMH